jgi:hypothetical protein
MLVVAGTHYAPRPLSLLWDNPPAVEWALFYVAQGIKGCVLYTVIMLLLPRKLYALPMWAVCSWGMLEDAQVAACRLARGVGTQVSVQGFQGLCDALLGLPAYGIGMALAVLVACIVEHGSNHAR